jgi:hypothetical protein
LNAREFNQKARCTHNFWTKSLAAFAFLGAVTLASDAPAALVSYTTSTPIPSTLTDWSGSLLFQQFDASLGTLNSVTIRLDTGFGTTLTVQNNSPRGSSGSVRTEFMLTPSDARFLGSALDIMTPSQGYVLGAGGTLAMPEMNLTGSSVVAYNAAGILADFTGSGDFAIDLSTLTQTVLTSTGGNTAASQVTDAFATGTVTYEYFSAVPEPAAYGLFAGVGLLGLLIISRRHGKAISAAA